MMDSGQQETRDQIASVIRVDEFGLPASDDEIQRVEREFDVPFPAWLRSIYRACNGFTTRWNTQSLLPLDDVLRHREIMLTTFEDPEESLPDWLPRAIVFFYEGGSGTCTTHWAALDDQLIKWCYGDWDEFDSPNESFFDLLRELQNKWDEWDQERRAKSCVPESLPASPSPH